MNEQLTTGTHLKSIAHTKISKQYNTNTNEQILSTQLQAVIFFRRVFFWEILSLRDRIAIALLKCLWALISGYSFSTIVSTDERITNNTPKTLNENSNI